MRKLLFVLLLLIIFLSFSACTPEYCDMCGEYSAMRVNDANGNSYNFCDVCFERRFGDTTDGVSPFYEGPAVLHEENIPIETTENILSVDEMEDRRPYLLCNGVISPIEELKIDADCMTETSISQIPVLSDGSQIIVRSGSGNLNNISIYSLDISWGFYVNPYVRFFFRGDTGKLTIQSTSQYYYITELQNAHEVDNIDGLYNFDDMPLYYWKNVFDSPAYFLYSYDAPCEAMVGYWKGTSYEEITVDVSYIPAEWWSSDWHECDFLKTREGYFILNMPDLESGYYVLRVSNSGNYAICIE